MRVKRISLKRKTLSVNNEFSEVIWYCVCVREWRALKWKDYQEKQLENLSRWSKRLKILGVLRSERKPGCQISRCWKHEERFQRRKSISKHRVIESRLTINNWTVQLNDKAREIDLLCQLKDEDKTGEEKLTR